MRQPDVEKLEKMLRDVELLTDDAEKMMQDVPYYEAVYEALYQAQAVIEDAIDELI